MKRPKEGKKTNETETKTLGHEIKTRRILNGASRRILPEPSESTLLLMILPPSNKGTRTIRTRPLHTVNIIIKMITDKRCAAPLNSDTQINCGAFEGHEWGGGGGEGVRGGGSGIRSVIFSSYL